MNSFHFRTKVCLLCSAVNSCVDAVSNLILYQEAIKTLSYLILPLENLRYLTDVTVDGPYPIWCHGLYVSTCVP